MSIPSADQIKARWKRQVGYAKIAWARLTDDELLETEGQMDKLVGLVQERYAITRDEASRRVRNFLAAR